MSSGFILSWATANEVDPTPLGGGHGHSFIVWIVFATLYAAYAGSWVSLQAVVFIKRGVSVREADPRYSCPSGFANGLVPTAPSRTLHPAAIRSSVHQYDTCEYKS